MEPVHIEISDILDLHTFHPKDVPELLDAYLTACIDIGIYSVRIIHGKGRGILKQRVHSILRRMPIVLSYSEAPLEAGGWGATIVTLKAYGKKDIPVS